MKKSTKDRLVDLLFEELHARISQREDIREKLGDMISMSLDVLVSQIVDDFAEVILKRWSELESEPDRNTPISEPPIRPTVQADDAAKQGEDTSEAFLEENSVEETSDVSAEKGGVEIKGDSEVEPDLHKEVISRTLRRKMDEIEKRLSSEIVKESEEKNRREIAAREISDASQALRKEERVDELPEEERGLDVKVNERTSQRNPEIRLSDDEMLYLHAVTANPVAETEGGTFSELETAGVDGRSRLIAFDLNDTRFIISRLNPDIFSVSKVGALLLSQGEARHLQNTCESILNGLRVNHPILPFRFGTTIRGKSILERRILAQMAAVRSALESQILTDWWRVDLFVLDERILQWVGKSSQTDSRGAMKERRVLGPPAEPKRLDVKSLERILLQEKNLATTIHSNLSAIAHEVELESIIGFGSGTTDSWKLILSARYGLREADARAFHTKVHDIRHQHIMFDPMVVVTGNQTPFELA